jgi:hypothetical protein
VQTEVEDLIFIFCTHGGERLFCTTFSHKRIFLFAIIQDANSVGGQRDKKNADAHITKAEKAQK